MLGTIGNIDSLIVCLLLFHNCAIKTIDRKYTCNFFYGGQENAEVI